MGLRGIAMRTVKPCSEDWAAMTGDARARHCAACDKVVHNLARMSARDVDLLALRSAMGEEVCARITRRADGELVTLSERSSLVAGKAAVVLAMAAGAPAMAQSAGPDERLPLCGPVPQVGEVVSGCWKPQPAATVTGRVLRPGGTPVNSGLLLVRAEGRADVLYVLDEIGTFEIHEEPGTYELLLQTRADEARRIGEVKLHEGYQSFGDVRTEANQQRLVEDTYPTMGAVVSTVRWSWRSRFRHPVLYAKWVIRSL